MMMNDISVIVYSYKGKLLKDVLKRLLDNSSSKSRIHFKIIDQHPLKRTEMFENEFDCAYTHMFWDWQHSPLGHKKTMLDATLEKYTLFIADNIFVQKDWDIELVEFIKDSDNIVSGNSNLKLEKDGNFFIKKNRISSSAFELTQFVDRRFIFGKTSTFNDKMKFPDYLKYNGEEECMSLELFTSGCDIFTAPSAMYSEIGKNNLDQLYVPFSLNHNYNNAIDLIQIGTNRFTSVNGRKMSVEDFNLFHNNIFKSLSKLPFQTNDVEYDPMDLNFNTVDARRFVARTKAIH
jgi:hypothetical protein